MFCRCVSKLTLVWPIIYNKMTSNSARGLRLIKAIKNYTKTKPNQLDTGAVFSKVKLLSSSEGTLRGTFQVDASMCNSLDTLHGGYVSTIIDVMSFFGQLSHEKGRISWTTNMNIVYLNPAIKGDQIAVEAAPIEVGKATAMEVTLVSEETKAIIAKGTTTFLCGSEKYQENGRDILGFDVYEI